MPYWYPLQASCVTDRTTLALLHQKMQPGSNDDGTGHSRCASAVPLVRHEAELQPFSTHAACRSRKCRRRWADLPSEAAKVGVHSRVVVVTQEVGPETEECVHLVAVPCTCNNQPSYTNSVPGCHLPAAHICRLTWDSRCNRVL